MLTQIETIKTNRSQDDFSTLIDNLTNKIYQVISQSEVVDEDFDSIPEDLPVELRHQYQLNGMTTEDFLRNNVYDVSVSDIKGALTDAIKLSPQDNTIVMSADSDTLAYDLFDYVVGQLKTAA